MILHRHSSQNRFGDDLDLAKQARKVVQKDDVLASSLIPSTLRASYARFWSASRLHIFGARATQNRKKNNGVTAKAPL
jgi:hypothetical protein